MDEFWPGETNFCLMALDIPRPINLGEQREEDPPPMEDEDESREPARVSDHEEEPPSEPPMDLQLAAEEFRSLQTLWRREQQDTTEPTVSCLQKLKSEDPFLYATYIKIHDAEGQDTIFHFIDREFDYIQNMKPLLDRDDVMMEDMAEEDHLSSLENRCYRRLAYHYKELLEKRQIIVIQDGSNPFHFFHPANRPLATFICRMEAYNNSRDPDMEMAHSHVNQIMGRKAHAFASDMEADTTQDEPSEDKKPAARPHATTDTRLGPSELPKQPRTH